MRYEHHLARAARRWAERPAVTCGTEQVTFGQLDARATGLAARLAGLGVRPGDRVADLRENSIESVVTDFGCAAAGAPRVSLNPRLADAEIGHLLRDSGPAVLLVDPVQGVRAHRAGFTDLVQHVVTDLACDERPAAGYPGAAGGAGPGDILAIRYTGGTTGRPKGAIRTHAHQQWVATNVLLDLCDLGEDDVLLHTQPLSHGAHVFVLPCVMRGARQVVLPRFDPNAVLATIAAERVTVLKLVPTMLHRLLDAMAGTTADLGSLRQVIYGAAAMPEALLRRALDAFGPILSQTYGQTEAPATISVLTMDDHRAALSDGGARLRSAGRPYSTVDVRILGPDGADRAPGDTGEITVRGPMTMADYWRSDQPSPVDDRGFVHTGDVGYLDADGYLFLVDRSRDVIITGGYNVYPREIEEVLHGFPGVAAAVVVGLPDPEWGERVVAAIVPDGDVDVPALLGHCRQHLSSYKVPREVRLVDALPTSAAGKYVRRDVVALLDRA